MNGEIKTASRWGVWIPVVALLVGIIIGFALGTVTGRTQGMQATEARYAALSEIAFPDLVTDYSITGTVTNLYGNAITLTVKDPNGVLSALGMVSDATREVSVNVTANTTFSLTDYSTISTEGAPRTRSITLDEIEVGDNLTARSAENIQGAGTFDATAIELVR